MGKKITTEEPKVSVKTDEEVDNFVAGVTFGRKDAFEQMKGLISNARLPQDVKTVVWYLIDEAQKNQ